MNRRQFVRSAAVGAGLVGAACRSGVTAAPGLLIHRARQQGGRLGFALTTSDLVRVQPLLGEYQAATQVTIVTDAFPYQSLYERLSASLGKAVVDYDLVSMDDPWLPRFGTSRYLLDVDELTATRSLAPDEGFIPELLALGRDPARGALWAIPWIGNIQLFAWRTDVLAALGLAPPTTWDDVLANAVAVTEARAADGLYGFGLRGRSGNPATTSFLPVLRGFGGEILNGAGEPQLETEAALAAMALHLKLATVAPPGLASVDHEENGRHVADGRTAQSADIWPDQLLEIFDPTQSRVADAIAIGAQPAQPGAPRATMTGAWLLGIPVNSRNPGLALEFIRWFTAPEQQRRLLLERHIPATRTAVMEDPEAVAMLPFLPDLLAATRAAVPRPRIPFYPEVERILGEQLGAALAGQIDGETALRLAGAQIRELQADT